MDELFRDHLRILDRYLADALERAGRRGVGLEGVIFHAGRAQTYPRDDQEVIFRTYPHFARWVPPLRGPEHLVLARPGARIKVVRVRPQDFWFDLSPQPPSYWEDSVDLCEVDLFDQAVEALGPLDGLAWVGPSRPAAVAAGIPGERIEPAELMAPLDWWRACKTALEVACTRRAAEHSAAGHVRARKAFKAWGSEREIHWAYLQASDQIERDVPYETIVALDEKSAILHYQRKRGTDATPAKVLLVDAGAAWDGYAADLTRTWCLDDAEPEFRELLEQVDRLERELVAMVRPGRPYLEIHLASQRRVAQILVEVGVVRASAEEALDRGLARELMPHGVGHHLGLQVHDVGGHQAEPEGGTQPPPAEFPYLRNTRTLEPGHLVTIEPGIYFNPVKLDPLRQGDRASLIDWELVDRLLPMGGIRIEDNVLCTEDGFDDLTRPLLEGPRGAVS